MTLLVQATVLQIVLGDDIRHRVKHELNVGGVGGAGEVSIDLLLSSPFVQVLKLALNVVRRFRVVVVAWKFREANFERRPSNLLLKQILLVQEEDDGGVHKPLVVAYGVKQLHALDHAVHLLVLGQDKIIARHGDHEDDGRHALEAVDPLFPLRSLATDVK